MGLDQYLLRKVENQEPVNEVYWRKANFVHQFFTDEWDERGFESDNLTEFPVTVEDLQILSLKCEKVLEDASMAHWELPTMSGFFFGSTEYDDWYMDDVKYTKEQIDKLLAERPLQEGEEFVYEAWY